MASPFVYTDAEYLVGHAAHFGISVDQYVCSAPEIGMQAIEIAHAGLVIAHPKISGESSDLTPRRLFFRVYEDKQSVSGEDNNTVNAYIPEQVEEFCRRRNIPPVVAAKVGLRVLEIAVKTEVGLNGELGVYANRTKDKRGSLESKLSFAVSPINMLIMHRKHTLRSKIRKPLTR